MNATRMLYPTGPWTADQDDGSDPTKKEVGRGNEPENPEEKKEE